MSANSEGAKENAAPPGLTQGRRRSSLAELFAARPSLESPSVSPSTSRASGTSMASALSQAQQQSKTRRLSITTLGLSGSATHGQQSSPFGSLKRGSSTNDVGRTSIDEDDSAIDDTDLAPPTITGSSRGGEGGSRGEGIGRGNGAISPLGRRFSFGARAYGDARVSGAGGPIDKSPGRLGTNVGGVSGGTSASNGGVASKGSSPPSKKGKEGFSWSETLRTRAERGSISAAPPVSTGPLSTSHNRSRSTVASEAATPAPIPKAVPAAPDHFQERILKGDFYMD